MRTHYGPWQPCWISNQHQKHKSGRGPSSEHFWQVWLISVQRFQRRRFKCEKLTDGRRTLTHDKSSHGLWPGELKMYILALDSSVHTLQEAKTSTIGRYVWQYSLLSLYWLIDWFLVFNATFSNISAILRSHLYQIYFKKQKR